MQFNLLLFFSEFLPESQEEIFGYGMSSSDLFNTSGFCLFKFAFPEIDYPVTFFLPPKEPKPLFSHIAKIKFEVRIY